MDLKTALFNFNLSLSLYKKMNKSDLKLFISHIIYNDHNKNLLISAKILLDNIKKKTVHFKDVPPLTPSKTINKYHSFDFDMPISYKIDTIFESSWNHISCV